MKVVIVGANGFVGRNLCRYLSQKGVEITAVSSADNSGIDPTLGIFPHDFSLAPNIDTVVYLSQSPFYRQVPEQAAHLLKVNVVSAVQAAEAARKAGARQFIYTSTGNVYKPSFSPLTENDSLNRHNWYSLSKIQAEEALSLLSSEIDISIVRLFGVYGPNQKDKLIPNLWNAIAAGKAISIAKNPYDPNDLDGLRLSLIYITDLLQILWQLMTEEKAGYCLNVASSEVVSIRKIAEIFARIQSTTPTFKILEAPRQLNLIADNTLLCSTLNPTFTPFLDGAHTLNC